MTMSSLYRPVRVISNPATIPMMIWPRLRASDQANAVAPTPVTPWAKTAGR